MKATHILFLFLMIGTTVKSAVPNDDDLFISPVSKNIYLVNSIIDHPEWGRVAANGLIYVDGKNAVIINTPWNDNQTNTLCNFITDSLKLKVSFAILTHSHADCMGGIAELKRRKIKTYSLDKTKELAQAQNLQLPDITFSDSLMVKVNTREILLFYPGGGHTIDNIVVWIPAEKVLFGGCLIKETASKTLGNTADADLISWPLSVENVKNRFTDARIIVPGHGQYGSAQLLTHTLELLKK